MLKLTDIHQTFHAGEVNEVRALRGVDLHLTSGQFVTVIGSNGAGKSTRPARGRCRSMASR